MRTEQLKQEIIDYAKEIGIDKIGFASADVFGELRERLRRQQESNFQSGFEKGSLEERTEPQRLLPEAQSIISIAIAYPSRMKDAPRSTKEERRGLFARASWGIDYHVVLRDRLEKLAAFIQEKVPEVSNKVMVDTGELSDRAVAERAGIGFSGKNTSIITPEFGSFVYLGEMITNIPFVPDDPIEDSCGDCTKCMDACPTGALVEGGRLNAQRCIAFLTQTKDFLPDEFRTKLGNRLYGCDTCQQVCPRNKGIDSHIHPEFEPEHDLAKPKLEPMLRISNRSFKEKFGHMSGSWRGKKPLQRNALIALGHYKDKTAIPEMISVMKEDPRPVIRGTAAWALGKIGTVEAFRAIEAAMENEKDDQVLFEMEKGLEFKYKS
ncbi:MULTISPECIES: tRNA epoxyqueuosine(34) reductase QueG [Oceanobacillus]|uniref:Epoxyqueuosine reductase n=1 Tax=Oceanobacillus profundus TaxID=372463 RepID=A0A417YLN9_9BACI|nr:tRNA epoxyqueuosine(34) reductase QueG [Oceanobacillus profundus]MCM3399342.1 tRNA epoxyqueuosine(34) reductase QueG [Oceanobacillus profundus]MDO6450302.1 tRNA epoxyqueuosine(34) reductase QueG [Oceanobacillus profundus]RHW34304.1 tRNA epoxyqueuosine(34) reductase QueG [Oceanobacillus profundus]